MLMGLHYPFLAAALLAAAPEPGTAPEPSAATQPNPAADDTRELFDKAATQYETSQYKEAVTTYTEAYQLSRSIEDETLRAKVQAAIFFNLARAHSKAYVLDESRDHLLKAVDLLEKYLAQTADLADKADAEELLEQTQAELERLDELERERRSTEGLFDTPPPAAWPAGDQGETPRDRRGMRIGGFSLVGLGVAAGGLAIGGAALASQAEGQYVEGPTRAEREAALQRGSTANALVVAGSVSAGVFVTVGVALLIAGRKRSKTAPTPSAWLSPTSAGLSLGGSF